MLDRTKAHLPLVSSPEPDIETLKVDLNAIKEALERVATTRGQETSDLEILCLAGRRQAKQAARRCSIELAPRAPEDRRAHPRSS